jgi:hypothetical protein
MDSIALILRKGDGAPTVRFVMERFKRAERFLASLALQKWWQIRQDGQTQ